MHFRTYQDSKKEWRWTLRADNNKTIADSGEGYKEKADCLHGIDLVKSAAIAPVDPPEGLIGALSRRS